MTSSFWSCVPSTCQATEPHRGASPAHQHTKGAGRDVHQRLCPRWGKEAISLHLLVRGLFPLQGGPVHTPLRWLFHLSQPCRWDLQAAESDLGEILTSKVISQPPRQKMKHKPRAPQKAEGKEPGSHPTTHWAISTTQGVGKSPHPALGLSRVHGQEGCSGVPGNEGLGSGS